MHNILEGVVLLTSGAIDEQPVPGTHGYRVLAAQADQTPILGPQQQVEAALSRQTTSQSVGRQRPSLGQNAHHEGLWKGHEYMQTCRV